jgi:phosphoribosylaminoimidazole-succinocarboxamide synthase
VSLPQKPVLDVQIPGLQHLHHGKVRDIFALGEELLLVASDRVSAFDVVMNEGMPGRGIVLTQLSRFWFERTQRIVPHHLVSVDVDAWDNVPAKPRTRCVAARCAARRPSACPSSGSSAAT